MSKTYSIYEAKARFSEILRQVREGKTITVSYRGQPVAEIRPIDRPRSLEQRFRRLEERGVLVRAKTPNVRVVPIGKRPGALRRFLDERGE